MSYTNDPLYAHKGEASAVSFENQYHYLHDALTALLGRLPASRETAIAKTHLDTARLFVLDYAKRPQAPLRPEPEQTMLQAAVRGYEAARQQIFAEPESRN